MEIIAILSIIISTITMVCTIKTIVTVVKSITVITIAITIITVITIMAAFITEILISTISIITVLINLRITTISVTDNKSPDAEAGRTVACLRIPVKIKTWNSKLNLLCAYRNFSPRTFEALTT